jgi:hypothetical protein
MPGAQECRLNQLSVIGIAEPVSESMASLQSSHDGLSEAEAQARLVEHGPNQLHCISASFQAYAINPWLAGLKSMATTIGAFTVMMTLHASK